MDRGDAATQWRDRDRGHFFSRSSSLDGEIPSGDQAECLAVVPTDPVADFVVCQPRFQSG